MVKEILQLNNQGSEYQSQLLGQGEELAPTGQAGSIRSQSWTETEEALASA